MRTNACWPFWLCALCGHSMKDHQRCRHPGAYTNGYQWLPCKPIYYERAHVYVRSTRLILVLTRLSRFLCACLTKLKSLKPARLNYRISCLSNLQQQSVLVDGEISVCTLFSLVYFPSLRLIPKNNGGATTLLWNSIFTQTKPVKDTFHSFWLVISEVIIQRHSPLLR